MRDQINRSSGTFVREERMFGEMHSQAQSELLRPTAPNGMASKRTCGQVVYIGGEEELGREK